MPSAEETVPLPPSLTWTHLLPFAVPLLCEGAPQWFGRQAAAHAQGATRPPVKVAWTSGAATLSGASPSDAGLVLVNARGLTENSFSAAGFGYARRFAVIPNLANARWFVPLDSARVSSAGLSLYTPSRVSAKFKRWALRLALRARLPFYRDHLWIAGRTLPPVEEALRGLFPSQDIRLALSSGAPEGARNRKVSAIVLATDGNILAFAKLACTPLSRRILANEARTLQLLAGRPGLRNLAPKLLLIDDLNGTRILAQTPLPGGPASASLTPAHRRLLELLRTNTRARASEIEMAAGLGERLESLPSPRPDLVAAWRAAMQSLETFSVPVTIVHGDFAPWNLRAFDGCIGAFDWEYGEPLGLPLVDELHYRLQTAWLLDGCGVADGIAVIAKMAADRPLGMMPEQVRAIARLYLLDAMARLLNEGYGVEHDVVVWHQSLLDRLPWPQLAAVGAS